MSDGPGIDVFTGTLDERRAAARLASWASAWLAGACAYDIALDAIAAGLHHTVTGPEANLERPLGALLTALRTANRSAVRLALPVPGDLADLPPGEEFRSQAVRSSAACVAVAAPGIPGPNLAVVPTILEHGSEAEGVTHSVEWSVFEVGDTPVTAYTSLADADHALREATREATETLLRLDVARWTRQTGTALDGIRRRARHGGPARDLPPGYPPRAADVLARADHLQAVVDLALDDHGGAVSQAEIATRRSALAAVSRVARTAVLAAYNCYGVESDDERG